MRKKLSRLIVFGALCAAAAPAGSYEGEMSDERVRGAVEAAKLTQQFARYLANIQTLNPEEATRFGIHESDMHLTPRDLESERLRMEALKNYLREMDKIDSEPMSPEDGIDFVLFRTKLEMDIFNIEQMRPLRTRPQDYLSALDAIYGVLTKDFDAYEIRSKNALARLEQLPAELQQAESNLYHPPRLWVEQAIQECDDADKSFPDLTPLFKRLIGGDPLLRNRVDQAVLGAREAIRHYRSWLKESAMLQADGDFRIGDEAYGYYLERWHHVDVTPPQALRLARRKFRRTQREFLDELGRFLGRRDVSAGDYEEAIYKLSDDHPARENIISVFQREIERAYQHFDRFRLTPVPQERMRTVETPSYMASRVPFAFYNAPYPLDHVRVAELYVNLPSKKLSEAVQDSMLRSAFNYPYIELTVAQEVYPGRHLQDSETMEVSRPRHLADQPCLTNGWAAYAQFLAMERGYYTSHAAKLLYLRWELVRYARAVVDAGLHIRKMEYEEAVDFLEKEAGLSGNQAKAEILRVSLNPTEGVSYLLGMDEILRLRDKYAGILDRKFDLRDFHRRLLSLGKIPVSMIDAELGRSYDQAIKNLEIR
ncbi:MAG: DUF885 domain-containing protein [Elusimicrobiales bacterium]|nr:DUF885 domain-containing protein [Elusimicrobiales bacterium]